MLLVIHVELWFTWRTTIAASNAAYDRSLLGAIKSIDSNISTESGGLAVELPYRMLEFFELAASGHVHYRVATEDGLVEIGNADLPPPAKPLITGQPQYIDAVYFGEPVRVGSYARMLSRPIAGQPSAQRVTIQVAESLSTRERFTRTLVVQTLVRDLLLMLVFGALLAAVIGWALRPLARLRHEVQSRLPMDLTPISTSAIPRDVRPLVEAINQHVQRTRELGRVQRQFVDDASHQLRTPLTTLATQVSFALRELHADHMRTAIAAVKSQLDETIRQTNQMLALARADSIDMETTTLSLVLLAEETTRSWWAEARSRQVDLELVTTSASVLVTGNAPLLKEALANLLHNAIRYTPPGGQVVVEVQAGLTEARLCVIDTGPGLSPADLARAGERFFRGSNASQPGSGLGLAIVKSIAERHGGRLELTHGRQGIGLSVSVFLPSYRPLRNGSRVNPESHQPA
ncbi:sensor histidine kinase [Piscinibacter sp. HJYY11]|uniref:sensor histidine kinase n=1 Tax=Piscinibacter sp. HJYY11 TaxID=2801333 RepID=UPI00191D92C6|nr:sensor histidine kinase [Piscinibacter sp. HJYY11]MBL0729433.1 sensor histidine kinase N-terminal domain-containing protein [Piscinibacter sp. HJYY11]